MKNMIFPHKFWRSRLDCMSQLFLDPNICGFQYISTRSFDPKLWWSIGRTNCSYHSTRVDLYSHQILLSEGQKVSRYLKPIRLSKDLEYDFNTFIILILIIIMIIIIVNIVVIITITITIIIIIIVGVVVIIISSIIIIITIIIIIIAL